MLIGLLVIFFSFSLLSLVRYGVVSTPRLFARPRVNLMVTSSTD